MTVVAMLRQERTDRRLEELDLFGCRLGGKPTGQRKQQDPAQKEKEFAGDFPKGENRVQPANSLQAKCFFF